jgi:hypothetical protein
MKRKKKIDVCGSFAVIQKPKGDNNMVLLELLLKPAKHYRAQGSYLSYVQDILRDEITSAR